MPADLRRTLKSNKSNKSTKKEMGIYMPISQMLKSDDICGKA